MRTLSTALQLLVLRDAARGMAHLHAHAARHCNLRAANLLLFDPFVVKVALTLTLSLTPTLTLTLTLTLLLFDPFVVKVSDARLRPEWAALSAEDAAHTAWKVKP